LNAIRVKLGALAAGLALVEALARFAAPMPPAPALRYIGGGSITGTGPIH
jgi:hypothetical protein